MSGYIDPDTLLNYLPTKYMSPDEGDAARDYRRSQLYTGYLMSTPEEPIARQLADQDAAQDRDKAERFHEMVRAARPGTGALSYADDLMRVLGNQSSFGIADHLEGLVNSLRYGTDVDDALGLSAHRTSRARENLGNYVGTGADALGTLSGYATMLPRLPLSLAGAGMLTPAAIPLEAIRGYFNTQGSPERRLGGAYRNVMSNPTAMFAPRTGAGTAANMFFDPLMEGAGLGDYTPSAYLTGLTGDQ